MSGTTTAVARLRAAAGGANRWVVLVVLCVSLLLVALDATVLHVAVPAVTEDLRPSGVELLWIVDAYPLVCAALLILFGTLGDRVGRRRVLLIGYGIFGAASAVAAFAGTPDVLIAARALLGVGGAMIMPATLSILRAVFPDRRERAMAIGIWTAVAAVGAATGPVLGGFLVEHFWWGSVFLINIPLMALIVPVGRWLLPESRGSSDGPWDVLGALMAAAGVLGVVLGVKRLGVGHGLLDAEDGRPAAGRRGCCWSLFVRRQRRRAHPLIDIRMFARATFSTSVGCIVLAMLALVGLELIAVQYLQLVLGLSPLETGLRLLPLTFAAMAAGATGSHTLRRVGPRRMVACGFVLTAAAVLLLVADGAARPALAAHRRFRPARLRPADHALRGVRVDAQRSPAGTRGRGGRDRRDLVPAGRGHGDRPARQRHERRVRARPGLPSRRAAVRELGGVPFAGRGVPGVRPPRRACRGGRCGQPRGTPSSTASMSRCWSARVCCCSARSRH